MNRYKCIGIPRSFLFKPNSNVVMNAEFNSPQSTPDMVNAIKATVKVHPLLRVSVTVDRHGDTWLIPGRKTAIRLCISDKQEHDSIRKSLYTPINPLKEGLFYFILTGDKYNCRSITMVCHHIICDGISLLNIFRDISQVIHHDYRAYSYPVVIMKEKMFVKPVIGIFVKKYISRKNAVWKKQAIERSGEVLDDIINSYLDKKKFSMTELIVEGGSLAGLLNAAQRYTVGLTAIIIGLVILTELSVLPHTDYRNRFSLAVNLRPFFEQDVNEQFGHFASGIQQRGKITRGRFWKQVKLLDNKLKKKLRSKEIFRLLALELFHPNFIDAVDLNRYGMRDDADIRKWIRMTGLDRISASFIVSNLGNVDWVNAGFLYKKISGPYMISDVTEKYLGIVTLDNRLIIAVSYIDNIIDKTMMSGFTKAFEKNLEEIVRGLRDGDGNRKGGSID